MFKKNYIFYGKHAQYVKELTAKLKENDKISIFERNLDVLLLSSIVGFVYGRRSEKDKEGEGNLIDTKVFAEQMIKETDSLSYIYELIMIMHNKNEDAIEIRIDRAFRYSQNTDLMREGMEIFNSYVLGGVEILYEKIIGDSRETDEYLANLYEFLDEFNTKYIN